MPVGISSNDKGIQGTEREWIASSLEVRITHFSLLAMTQKNTPAEAGVFLFSEFS